MAAKIVAIEHNVADIKLALIGNPELGHRGLVQRIDDTEKKVEAHDRKLFLWGGIMTFAVALVTLLKEKLMPGK